MKKGIGMPLVAVSLMLPVKRTDNILSEVFTEWK